MTKRELNKIRKILLIVLFATYTIAYFVFMPKYTINQAVKKVLKDERFANSYEICVDDQFPTMRSIPKSNFFTESVYIIKVKGEENYNIYFDPVTGKYSVADKITIKP